MSQAIDRILEAAKKARPPRACRGRYATIYPIVRTLTQNGFNVTDAVTWLLEQNTPGVTAKKLPTIIDSLQTRLRRERKKTTV